MVAQPVGTIIGGLTCLAAGAAVVGVAADSDQFLEPTVSETADYAPKMLQQEIGDLRLECATGAAEACYTLGHSFEVREDLWGQPVKGEGVRRDDAQAARYFRQSCDLGHGDACKRLGGMYEQGKGVTRNKAEAARVYEKACTLQGGSGCTKTKKSPNVTTAPTLRP